MEPALITELKEIETDLRGKIKVTDSGLDFTIFAVFNGKFGLIMIGFLFLPFIAWFLYVLVAVPGFQGKLVSMLFLLFLFGFISIIFWRSSTIDFTEKEFVSRISGFNFKRISVNNIARIHITENSLNGIYVASIISLENLRGKKTKLIVIRKRKNVNRFISALNRVLRELNPDFGRI